MVDGECDSFVDRGDQVVHFARNVSATDEVALWATYIVPGLPAGPFRLDEPVAPGRLLGGGPIGDAARPRTAASARNEAFADLVVTRAHPGIARGPGPSTAAAAFTRG